MKASDPWLPLSPQEDRVVGLVAEGMLLKQIAFDLDVTLETVKTYLKRARAFYVARGYNVSSTVLLSNAYRAEKETALAGDPFAELAATTDALAQLTAARDAAKAFLARSDDMEFDLMVLADSIDTAIKRLNDMEVQHG